MREFEVSKILRDVDLTEKTNSQAKHLSGGQKRKLSVGIAIIGDPKVRARILCFCTRCPKFAKSISQKHSFCCYYYYYIFFAIPLRIEFRTSLTLTSYKRLRSSVIFHLFVIDR